MALLTSEIQRCRFELGYNVLAAGAEPYVAYHALFDTVVATYLNAGASTTSTTSVTAATTPTPVTLTLASATGFSSGATVAIDVDTRQEVVTIQSLSGTAMTVQLTGAHSGTYAVTVDGGEGIVRECLKRIRDAKGRMATTYGYGALKKVDEVEFYKTDRSQFGTLGQQVTHWRDELSAALGVPNLWTYRQAASLTFGLV